MKSKKLLMLLVPLTLGVNAATLDGDVSPSVSEQEVMLNAEPQIPQPKATTDVLGEDSGIAEKQESNAVLPAETVSTQSVPQPTSLLSSLQNNNDADLVNKMFDKDGKHERIQVAENSETLTSTSPMGEASASEPPKIQDGMQEQAVVLLEPSTNKEVQQQADGSNQVVENRELTQSVPQTVMPEAPVLNATTTVVPQTPTAEPAVAENVLTQSVPQTVVPEAPVLNATTTVVPQTPIAEPAVSENVLTQSVPQTVVPEAPVLNATTTVVPQTPTAEPAVAENVLTQSVPQTVVPEAPVLNATTTVVPQTPVAENVLTQSVPQTVVPEAPVLNATTTVVPQATELPKVSRNAPLTFGANLLQRINPKLIQGISVQQSDNKSTELAKENVSDFLVSQAEHKVNATDSQSNAVCSVPNTDVKQIQNSIDGINTDVASIKENLSLLAVAITAKSGNLDAETAKVIGIKDTEDHSESQKSVFDEKDVQEKQSDDTERHADDHVEDSDYGNVDEQSSDESSTEEIEKEHLDDFDTNSSVLPEGGEAAVNQHESTLSEESEDAELDAVKTKVTESEEEESEALKSNSTATTKKGEQSMNKESSAELPLILQEIRKVNNKIDALDEKVNGLSIKTDEVGEVNEVQKTKDDEMKKKNS